MPDRMEFAGGDKAVRSKTGVWKTQKWTIRHHVAGVEKTIQEWTYRHGMSRVDNVGNVWK